MHAPSVCRRLCAAALDAPTRSVGHHPHRLSPSLSLAERARAQPTALLRFQVRQKLKKLRREDKDILWEGIETLSEKELRQDLRARGLPTKALNEVQMRETLTNWLSLSQKKEIPCARLAARTDARRRPRPRRVSRPRRTLTRHASCACLAAWQTPCSS